MEKNKGKVVLFRVLGLGTITLIIVILLFIGYRLFFDLESLPEGVFISEVSSPMDEYTIKFYINETSLSSPSLKGVLFYNEQDNQRKTIYNEYKQHEAIVEWVDNDTIIINGHQLNILEDVYDWRREN